ncbi:protein ANTAGONIST OF LIKE HETEROCHROMATIN PROTEIN 1-like [Lucilia cuprina]|uniref:protein ANTAGONIST OF LIKE HETEROCHROMATIN PROTEIN 1-like n=1 Tax=Lucilia cuprina TaxID=7375 RepID=UPI001F070F11|nr:protein ANTAGONIST OF LIKE HETEROCHROMATIN PROTEIN 1-like [Lucilia cuprina]
MWVKDWVLHREQEGFHAKLLIKLRSEEPELYSSFLRMDSDQFDHLLNLVTPYIQKQDTNMRKSISADERLVLTLRYLATGENFRSLQYLFRIPASTISKIIPEVLDAIYIVLVDVYLETPKEADAWEAIAGKFNDLWQFPNCIGAVDGKHIVMDAPANSCSIFYNYKGTHSIILMGIADAEYRFLYIDVGRNGRFSDGGVFNRCTFGQALDTNQLCLPPPKALPGRQQHVPYVLVADDAFALRCNLLKPYSQRGLTMVQRVFNYRLSRARRIIENVFGIMSSRFRVLRKPISLNPEKTIKVTLACCVIHNFLITTNKKSMRRLMHLTVTMAMVNLFLVNGVVRKRREFQCIHCNHHVLMVSTPKILKKNLQTILWKKVNWIFSTHK